VIHKYKYKKELLMFDANTHKSHIDRTYDLMVPELNQGVTRCFYQRAIFTKLNQNIEDIPEDEILKDHLPTMNGGLGPSSFRLKICKEKA
jgi:hypothetical protein